MKNIFYLLPFLFLTACKSQPKQTSFILLPQNHKIIFMDSIAAGEAITKDDKENYFSQVNYLDMSIQMKKNINPETPRNEVLHEYKTFLKQDVLDFTKEEKDFINEVFKEAFELSNKVSPNIFPKELRLIKTHANHYGKGAFYTREHCIIIPKETLVEPNHDRFMETMFHEMSHIYTRYHPEKRKQLYGFIGFKKIGTLSNLTMKNELKERVLLNPDGINFAYAIDLKEKNDQSYSAIPIIFANETKYVSRKPSFFHYLGFSLFKIKMQSQNDVTVVSDEEGLSTIDMDHVPDFFEQITDNTGYIIHPDEIIADNFMFIMMREKSNALKKDFSDDGIELLKNMTRVLKN